MVYRGAFEEVCLLNLYLMRDQGLVGMQEGCAGPRSSHSAVESALLQDSHWCRRDFPAPGSFSSSDPSPSCVRSHHICLEVEDIAASMAHVGARVRLLDKQARLGAHGLPVVFAHPKDMCGVLTELEEVQRR